MAVGTARNTVAATPLETVSADLGYSIPLCNGRIELGLGYERIEDPASSSKNGNARGFLRWQSR